MFATPQSESGQLVQRSIDALRCQLVDRDTDVRFVDVTELPDKSATSGNENHNEHGALRELAGLRGGEHPDFEMVLIGKDGGVKARTIDANALPDFLALIDLMPMRRAEMQSRAVAKGGCM